MTPPTLSDVVRSYRLFLGRDVETTAVAAHHVATSDSVWELIERIWASPEAVRRRIGEAACALAATDEADAASLSATPDQLARIFTEVEADWARRGFGSRHRWLLRDRPRYDARSIQWNLARALETGRHEAAALGGLFSRTGLRLDPAASVAVLGEEAFRLAGALTAGPYLGIAPGPEETEAARAALAERGLPDAQLTTVTQFRSRAAGYDLFYSVMALQYAPPPMSSALLGRALEQVRPGGFAYFQLACQLHDYRFDAAAYLAGDGRDPHGEIHALPQHQVLALLDRHGFAPIEVKLDGALGPIGVSYAFFARKRG